jgi:hypothetical protein
MPHRLASVLFALGFCLLATACSAAPIPAKSESSASGAARLWPVREIRSDFDNLYTQLQASHYNLFARRARSEYDAEFKRMRGSIDQPLPLVEISKLYQRFVAYGNVAHARIDPPAEAWEAFRQAGGKAFPLYVRVVGGKAYLGDDYSGVPGLLQGQELVAVDGVPAMRWLARMRAHVSGDNDYMGYTQLETQLPLLVWEELGEVPQFQVQVRTSGGKLMELTLPARDRAGFDAAQAKWPARFELDWNKRQATMLEGGLAYLRPGPFYDNRPEAAHPWDPANFQAFLDASFADFLQHDAKALLIDLRDNPGGDNSFSDPMIAWFADKPFRFSEAFDIKVSAAAIESNRKRLQDTAGDQDSTSARLAAAYAGKPLGSRVSFPIPLVSPRPGLRFTAPVYLLVNRHSYSNTVLVAAIAQDYGFGKVLGEETADLASTYGALEKFTLPKTGIEVSFPKARILRPSGDPQARGVIPEIAIFTPLTAGRDDVVLEKAKQIILPRR